MGLEDGQRRRWQRRRSEELDSTGEDLDQRVMPLDRMNRYRRDLDSRNMLGASPFLPDQARLRTPCIGHRPKYLL